MFQIIPSTGSLTIPQMRPYRSAPATTTSVTSGTTNSTTRFTYQQQPKRLTTETGPPITVFVGNIVEHAPDLMIRQILGTCGHVISWKRIQGNSYSDFDNFLDILTFRYKFIAGFYLLDF